MSNTDLRVPRRRRLRDLFVVGKPLTLSDSEGDVDVYIQKIAPAELDECIKAANAVRAKIKALQYQASAEERIAEVTDSDVNGLLDDRESMIFLLERDELYHERISVEEKLGAEERWAKDGHLEGLRTAWLEGLADKWQLDKEDPEAAPVWAELKEFDELCEREMAAFKRSTVRKYDDAPDDEIRSKVIDLLIGAKADDEWLNEYKRQEMFFSVRDPDDHDELYFDSPDDIGYLHRDTRRAISEVIEDLGIESREGKG